MLTVLPELIICQADDCIFSRKVSLAKRFNMRNEGRIVHVSMNVSVSSSFRKRWQTNAVGRSGCEMPYCRIETAHSCAFTASSPMPCTLTEDCPFQRSICARSLIAPGISDVENESKGNESTSPSGATEAHQPVCDRW